MEGLTYAGVAALTDAWVCVRRPWLAEPRGRTIGAEGCSWGCSPRAWWCVLGVPSLLLAPFEGRAPLAGGEVSGVGLCSVSRTYLVIEDCVFLQVTGV